MLSKRHLRTAASGLLVSFALSGCTGYRLVRPGDLEFPSYEPREVLIPAECETLIGRAATEGAHRLNEGEARFVSFCQQQQLIRAQEEEAAARRLEAHAEAASFALRVTTVVLGATFAVLAWLF